MGLPDLNDRDQALIRRHSFMYRHAIKWVRAHIARGGSGYLENPFDFHAVEDQMIAAAPEASGSQAC